MSLKKTIISAGLLVSTLEATANYVSFDVTKNKNSPKIHEKRSSDGDLNFIIENEQSYYSVELVIGSDKQKLTALLDTGSSDLWVLGETAAGLDACDAYLESAGYLTSSKKATSSSSSVKEEISDVQANCVDLGTYSPSSSSSFKKEHASDPFEIQYGDLTFADGYWASDSLTVNGVAVDGLLFGVAESSNSSNVCGISFPYLESSDEEVVSSVAPFTYANLPQLLKNDGLINKVAYSLFLNSFSASSGDLLFGGVDTAKYTGTLSTIPLVNIYSSYYSNPIEFDVTLQGTGFYSSDGSYTTYNDQYFAALFDSGTTLLVLPQDLADMFAASVNAEWDNDVGFYTLECPSSDVADESAYVFQFGGVNYYIPLSNYILQTSSSSTCYLGVQPSDDQQCIIGDNTLSSLYVVYDMDDYQISLAQANYEGASESSIEIIESAIPGAEQAPGYSKTWTQTVAEITSGGDIFSGSKPTNPWAKRDVKTLKKRDSSGNSTSTLSTVATSASSNTSATSVSSKNGASLLSFSIAAVIVALIF
ncbi:hypothetical protein QEN19_001533 [Hanseniaspora menglaensis]